MCVCAIASMCSNQWNLETQTLAYCMKMLTLWTYNLLVQRLSVQSWVNSLAWTSRAKWRTAAHHSLESVKFNKVLCEIRIRVVRNYCCIVEYVPQILRQGIQIPGKTCFYRHPVVDPALQGLTSSLRQNIQVAQVPPLQAAKPISHQDVEEST